MPRESSSCSSQASSKMFTFPSPLSSLLSVKFQICVKNSIFSAPFYPLWKGEAESGQLDHSWKVFLCFFQDTIQGGEMSWVQQQAQGEPSQEQDCSSPSPRLLGLCTPIPWGTPPFPPLPCLWSCLCRDPDTFWERTMRGSALSHFTSHSLQVLASRPHAF